MADPGASVDELLSHVLELAVSDSARAWLTASFETAAYELALHRGGHREPTALTATCQHGDGALLRGRLTGRWPAVVGARYADWLLLPAHSGSPCRVLVSRDDARIDAATEPVGLDTAGVCDVTISDVAVDTVRVFDTRPEVAAVLTGACAAAVVGSAEGLWRRYVGHTRAQLAASSAGDASSDAAASHVARAASDIDAATLQITHMLPIPDDLDTTVWGARQAVARARSAADRLLENSRHGLDSSHPVTTRWQDVHAGSQLAAHLFHGLTAGRH